MSWKPPRRDQWDRQMQFGRLLDFTGIYLVRFPDRVKVGTSGSTFARLRIHAQAGGLEGVVFSIGADDRHGRIARFTAEHDAIDALTGLAPRYEGRAEEFVLDFALAVRVVRERRMHDGEVAFGDLQGLYSVQPERAMAP